MAPSTTGAFAVQMRPSSGIDDARELRGGEVAVPAMRAVGPRLRRHAVVADALRYGAADRPRNAARWYRPSSRSDSECRGRRRPAAARRPIARAPGLVMSEASARASCATQRCAYSRPRASFQTIGPQMVQRIGPSSTAPPLAAIVSLKTSKAFGPSGVRYFFGIARIGLDANEVAPVAAGVGESPRDVAVAADDEAREGRAA